MYIRKSSGGGVGVSTIKDTFWLKNSHLHPVYSCSRFVTSGSSFHDSTCRHMQAKSCQAIKPPENGTWDEVDDTVLQTHNLKFEPLRSVAKHATLGHGGHYWIFTSERGEQFVSLGWLNVHNLYDPIACMVAKKQNFTVEVNFCHHTETVFHGYKLSIAIDCGFRCRKLLFHWLLCKLSRHCPKTSFLQ